MVLCSVPSMCEQSGKIVRAQPVALPSPSFSCQWQKLHRSNSVKVPQTPHDTKVAKPVFFQKKKKPKKTECVSCRRASLKKKKKKTALHMPSFVVTLHWPDSICDWVFTPSWPLILTLSMGGHIDLFSCPLKSHYSYGKDRALQFGSFLYKRFLKTRQLFVKFCSKR